MYTSALYIVSHAYKYLSTLHMHYTQHTHLDLERDLLLPLLLSASLAASRAARAAALCAAAAASSAIALAADSASASRCAASFLRRSVCLLMHTH
jgi:acyl-homoserine lactone acylase PvdQ